MLAPTAQRLCMVRSGTRGMNWGTNREQCGVGKSSSNTASVFKTTVILARITSECAWLRFGIRQNLQSSQQLIIKKPNMHHQNSSRIKLVGAGWPWKRIFQYLSLLQHLSPVSMAAECRKQSYAAVSARLHSALQPLYFWKQHFRALPSSCTGEGARELEFDENLIKEIEEHEAKPCSHCCYFRLPSAATERPTRGFVSYVGGYSWMCLKRHF